MIAQATTSCSADHDFNNTWGSVLGVTELQERPIASSLMKRYWQDPVRVGRSYDKILSQYMDKFESFFDGVLPVSFHGHVTDAICPVTVTGMLMRLAIVSKCDELDSIHAPCPLSRPELASLLSWTEDHLENPRWAVIEDSYASGFGSMANLSGQPAFRDHATGRPGIRIKLVNQTKADLSAVLRAAKQQGCIGVVVEIVNNQYNGRVTTPEELSNLSEACQENDLILALDETITALRCGAPFAHQRPEYSKISKPDLVFFGKAVGANGVGINFDAPYMRRLGINTTAKKMQAIHDWQSVVTQPLHLTVLIEALGILEMAVAGKWTERAGIIGQHLRQIARDRAQALRQDDADDEVEVIGGLDSFIFVHKKVASTFLVMGASNAGPWVKWVRWMPRMDSHLTDRSIIEVIMSDQGLEQRKAVSRSLDEEGLQPPWCFYCGNSSRETEHAWCRNCCIGICDAEECIHQLKAHRCLV